MTRSTITRPRCDIVLLVDQETGLRTAGGAFSVDRSSVESQVLRALRLQHLHVVVVPYDPEPGVTVAELRARNPLLVFNLTEWIDGARNRDHEIAALLERLDFRYTGTGPAGLRLCRDKVKVNGIAARQGLEVPRNFVIKAGQRVPASPLGYPLFVKPAQGDGSDHIGKKSLVRNAHELRERVRVLRAQNAEPVLCEEYIAGRDVFVALLGNAPRVLQALELVVGRAGTQAPCFATARLKHNVPYQRHWQVRYRDVVLPISVKKAIRTACVRLFGALHLRDYARLDFRLTPDNRLVFIEANPNPDLGQHTFGRNRCFAGVPYADLIACIVKAARRR